jgi:hypothetical protein
MVMCRRMFDVGVEPCGDDLVFDGLQFQQRWVTTSGKPPARMWRGARCDGLAQEPPASGLVSDLSTDLTGASGATGSG